MLETPLSAQPTSLTARYLSAAEPQPSTSCGAEQVIARATVFEMFFSNIVSLSYLKRPGKKYLIKRK